MTFPSTLGHFQRSQHPCYCLKLRQGGQGGTVFGWLGSNLLRVVAFAAKAVYEESMLDSI